MSPDLAHIDTWLFDLDNTLYPAESGFMGQVEQRMTDFVMRVTGLAREPAYALQKQYLAEHGLTLRGLMLNHGVDPADSRMTALSLIAMSLGIPGFMASKVLLSAFYARQDTKTPMRAAVASPSTGRSARASSSAGSGSWSAPRD